ncbi:MAG: CdaR family protein [Planctomycetota bacterium]|jgi:hypothetical protein
MNTRRTLQPLNLLFSLVLAMLVWAYVDDRRVETQSFEVPIEVIIPSGWEVRSRLPQTLTANLRGPKELMKSLSLTDLALSYTIARPSSDSDSHTEPIPIDPEDIRTPPGVEVVDLDLKDLDVRMVRLVPYYVRVRANIIGKPAKGFRITSAYPDPNWVKVLVPKGTLGPGDELQTYPLDINNASQPIYRRVGIKPTVLSNRLITSNADTLVSVVIDPLPQRRTLEKVPVRILYGLLGLKITKITPSTISLTLEGPQAEVEKMSEQSCIVYADLREITGQPQGQHPLRLKAQLPPGIQIHSLTPTEATVTIEYEAKSEPLPKSGGTGQ